MPVLGNRFMRVHEEQALFGYPDTHYLTSPVRAAAVWACDPHGADIWAGNGFSKAIAAPVARS